MANGKTWKSVLDVLEKSYKEGKELQWKYHSCGGGSPNWIARIERELLRLNDGIFVARTAATVVAYLYEQAVTVASTMRARIALWGKIKKLVERHDRSVDKLTKAQIEFDLTGQTSITDMKREVSNQGHLRDAMGTCRQELAALERQLGRDRLAMYQVVRDAEVAVKTAHDLGIGLNAGLGIPDEKIMELLGADEG